MLFSLHITYFPQILPLTVPFRIVPITVGAVGYNRNGQAQVYERAVSNQVRLKTRKTLGGRCKLKSSSHRIFQKVIPTRFKHRGHSAQAPMTGMRHYIGTNNPDTLNFVPGFSSISLWISLTNRQSSCRQIYHSLCPKAFRNTLSRKHCQVSHY